MSSLPQGENFYLYKTAILQVASECVQEEKVRGISTMMSVPLNMQPVGKRISADTARAHI
jgi:hypothetical protein